MKHEYVDASDLIQTDMRSGNEKKLDAMLDERGANEMGAETAVVLRNIALELMAQLEQDEKTRPASDADMAVYHEISSNYNKDRSALAAQIHPRTPGGEMKPTQQEIIGVARDAGIVFDERAMPYYERLVHLALERFGAGGGEPFAKVESALAYCTGFHARLIPGSRMPKVGTVLYTHPSPTDLRAEYLRGLEDAAKVCEYVATLYSEAARKHPEDSESRSRTFARSRAASQCVEEIRALLKGKQ